MPLPTYGALPLAKTFLVIRALQLVCFAGIVGITANFVALIVSSGSAVAPEIVGTLAVASFATLYTLITIPFFYADASTTLFLFTAVDFLLLIAFIVIAVVLGRPLSYLNCFIISDAAASHTASNAFAFTQSIQDNLGKDGSKWLSWSGSTKASCFEAKSVWGLSIALCILFFSSSLVLPALFAKKKRAALAQAKSPA